MGVGVDKGAKPPYFHSHIQVLSPRPSRRKLSLPLGVGMHMKPLPFSFSPPGQGLVPLTSMASTLMGVSDIGIVNTFWPVLGSGLDSTMFAMRALFLRSSSNRPRLRKISRSTKHTS